MHIQTIRLRNFKAFQDVAFTDIPRFCVLVGANGVGKSTFFDVLGFLKDCLAHNVRQALNKLHDATGQRLLARRIAPYLDPERSRSRRFGLVVESLRR